MRRHREHIRSSVVFDAESAHQHERNLQRSRRSDADNPSRGPCFVLSPVSAAAMGIVLCWASWFTLRPGNGSPTHRRAAPTDTHLAPAKFSWVTRRASATAADTPPGIAAPAIKPCTGRRSTATARRWTGPRRCGCPRSEPRPLDLYGGGPTAVVDPGHSTATPRARAGCSNCGAHPHAGPLVTATPPWPAVTAPTYIHEGRRPAARRCKQRNYMAQTEIRKATTDTSEGNPPAAEAG